MQLIIMKRDIGNHKKGDIIEIRATSTPFGGLEPESFVMIEDPNSTIAEYDHLNKSWETAINFSVVASDLAQDGYRLKLFSTLTDSSKLGAVTRDQVEKFITSWNGSVVSTSINEIVFDIKIFDALQSRSFWEVDMSKAVFKEQSYDQDTGIHIVQIDFSALGNNPSYIERYAAGKGATILSNIKKVMTVEVSRNAVRTELQRDIAEKGKRQIARRRYCVPPEVVDAAILNGGTMTVTAKQIATYIKDKVAE